MKQKLNKNKMIEIMRARHIINKILQGDGYEFIGNIERVPIVRDIFYDAQKIYKRSGNVEMINHQINIAFINDHYKITIKATINGEALHDVPQNILPLYRTISGDLINHFGDDGECVFTLLDDGNEYQDYHI